jgi:hypothetical protein
MVSNRLNSVQTLVTCGRALAVAFALCTIATASYALGTAEQRAACTPDVFRLCSSEIPNVDGIIACMKVKKASLSPAFRAVFDDSAPTKTAAGTSK